MIFYVPYFRNKKMRKFFLSLCVLSCLTLVAQKPNKFEELQQSIAKQAAELDSIQKVTDSLLTKRRDSIEMARFNEQSSRNLDGLVRVMKEREQKQKQQIWMRLGFGILMLGVLIFGLIRKRKNKEIQ